MQQHQFRVQNLVHHSISSTDVDEEALEIPPISAVDCQRKIYATFGDSARYDGKIRYAIRVGYLPVLPAGLAIPSGIHRLSALFDEDEDEMEHVADWWYLPVAMEGNYTAWKAFVDVFVDNYLYKEPKKEGDHWLRLRHFGGELRAHPC
ncbi:unnamed protein product [Vitrella brassicaformis CCMP3155]|uniref:Uncharacterized protein n=1 Tax=Vitrella brassicaformis (strain CCMP3155) TaxID=1169540 RepID=A0A0G4GPV4_VITBC|nr:unnamed protein product [Vitrella brassicaformis CCMP3155]|eukprot:CEM32394.1 unnamed protein product [Vitrella brassicaformis CCMP3155]